MSGVEAARSRMELAADLTAAGYERVSARVCGASTPRVPAVTEMTEALSLALPGGQR